jgi:hypothetical protein
MFVIAVETWLCTLLACDRTLSMALLTLSALLSSLPQPDTAKPAPAPNTAIPSSAAMAAGRRVNLLDSSSMLFLLLPEWMDADPIDGLY